MKMQVGEKRENWQKPKLTILHTKYTDAYNQGSAGDGFTPGSSGS